MKDICAICEVEHELKVIDSGVDGDSYWINYLCHITGKTFTRIIPLFMKAVTNATHDKS